MPERAQRNERGISIIAAYVYHAWHPVSCFLRPAAALFQPEPRGVELLTFGMGVNGWTLIIRLPLEEGAAPEARVLP